MTDIILESISDGVFTVDAAWRITSFNRSAERIVGIGRKDAIGKLCHEVFKSDMCEGECPLRRTLKTGKPAIDKKGFCVDPAGRIIPISVSTAVLYDEDGRPAGGAETFRDLREIEQLRGLLDAGKEAPIARSKAMRRVFDLLPTVAASEATVLVEGETGTGKEVVARALHAASGRSGGPFVAVNCAALPETLLESELFGYKKGAFTGADRDKPGRFRLARGGTIFLDEIGDLPSGVQVKLLRVLQEREYEPLGSRSPEKADVRVVCATNKDLGAAVERGEFRSDLFYRINVINLHLPPLRERTEDIVALAERFLSVFSARMGKPIRGFSPDAVEAFQAYAWPGNVRELENAVERAAVLCGGAEIGLDHLPAAAATTYRAAGRGESSVDGSGDAAPGPLSGGDAEPASLADLVAGAERRAIIEAISRRAGKRSAAAADLGIDKATLYRKMAKLGIGR